MRTLLDSYVAVLVVGFYVNAGAGPDYRGKLLGGLFLAVTQSNGVGIASRSGKRAFEFGATHVSCAFLEREIWGERTGRTGIEAPCIIRRISAAPTESKIVASAHGIWAG